MNREDRGRREFAALLGRPTEQALAAVRACAPRMYDTMIDTAAVSLANPELGRADRELATVAMLAALGDTAPQLTVHVQAALHNGIAPAELRALAEHVSLYAGFPRALNALATIDAALTGAGISRPAQLHRVTLADHETVVAQRGDSGPAVLLVHALGLDWQMWDHTMDRLAAGWRVFAYDVRGHGFAAGSPSPYTMQDTARDLVGVLDALDVDRAHVVGLSFGGAIAQTAAVSHPERFASLSLLATTDHPFEAFEGRARSGEVDGMAAQVVPSLTRWFTPGAIALNGWGVRYARERVLRGDATDWAAAWRAFQGLDVRDRLAEFEPPTLVLAGEADLSTTPEIMKGVAERVTGSVYRELPGTPHMQSLEQPDLVADALTDFLETR